MDSFFCSTFYTWLSGLCGNDLDYYLAGYNAETGNFFEFGQTSYVFLGTWMLIISLATCAIYYYSPFTNSPTFNRGWHWALIGGIGSIINMIVGTVSCNNAVVTGDVARALQITDEAQMPSFGNCIGFGLENFIWSFIAYFIFSFIIKWWSTNCKRTPFC